MAMMQDHRSLTRTARSRTAKKLWESCNHGNFLPRLKTHSFVTTLNIYWLVASTTSGLRSGGSARCPSPNPIHNKMCMVAEIHLLVQWKQGLRQCLRIRGDCLRLLDLSMLCAWHNVIGLIWKSVYNCSDHGVPSHCSHNVAVSMQVEHQHWDIVVLA
jgi:hypothetical protein